MQGGESIPGMPPQRSNFFFFNWYRNLSGPAVHAFWASFLGYALDAFDFQICPLILTTIATSFKLDSLQTALILAVTLIVSAFGGILAGVLVDRIGRVKTLMLTIGVYALFTFLSGLSPNYMFLLIFRTLQGLGFGGEWGAGAVLIAEVADPAQRGQVLGCMQSAWAFGWALALAACAIVFSFHPATDWGWRIVFWLGVLPALLLLYIRSNVDESDVYIKMRQAKKVKKAKAVKSYDTNNSLIRIFQPDLIRTTLLATVLAIGAQGGYYAIFSWVPAFLQKDHGLFIGGNLFNLGANNELYILMVILGSFLGYITSGYIHDRLGRRKTFIIFAVGSAVLVLAYTHLPNNIPLLFLGSLLGFSASGIFSGFGSYLAELFPSDARGAGQGFVYNVGRSIGASFSLIVGILSPWLGLGGAIGLDAFAYALCVVSLLFLPETKGKKL